MFDDDQTMGLSSATQTYNILQIINNNIYKKGLTINFIYLNVYN